MLRSFDVWEGRTERGGHFRCVGEVCDGSSLPQHWLCESHKHWGWNTPTWLLQPPPPPPPRSPLLRLQEPRSSMLHALLVLNVFSSLDIPSQFNSANNTMRWCLFPILKKIYLVHNHLTSMVPVPTAVFCHVLNLIQDSLDDHFRVVFLWLEQTQSYDTDNRVKEIIIPAGLPLWIVKEIRLVHKPSS